MKNLITNSAVLLSVSIACGLAAGCSGSTDPAPAGSGGGAGTSDTSAGSGATTGSGGPTKALGDSCTCAGQTGDYTCQSTEGPCESALTCVGDSTFGAKCYGDPCCMGSSCDPFTPMPGTGPTGCPSGQSCTIFNNKLYGYCSP